MCVADAEAVALGAGAVVVGVVLGDGAGDVEVPVALGGGVVAVAGGVAVGVEGDSGKRWVSVGSACPWVAPAAVEVTALAARAIAHEAMRTARAEPIARVKRQGCVLTESGRHTSTPNPQATPSE